MRRWTVSVPLFLLGFVILSQTAGNAAQRPGSPAAVTAPVSLPERAAMIDREIRALEFDGGGSPLTPAERQQAARIVDVALQTNAAGWRQIDRDMQQFLDGLVRGNEAHRVYMRERSRYNYAFPESYSGPWRAEYAAEKKIVETHDPVIAIDPARKLLFTEGMLPSLRRTATWVAGIYGLPAPRADFEQVIREYLRQRFTGIDPHLEEGYAHIEEDAPYTVGFFSTPKERLTQYVARTRNTLGNVQDARNEQVSIAGTAGLMSHFATTHGGAAPPVSGSRSKLQQSRDAYRASEIMVLCGPGTSEVQRVQNGCLVQ